MIVFTQLVNTLQIIHVFDSKVVFFSSYYITRLLCHSFVILSVQLCMNENAATLKEYHTENMTLQSSLIYGLRNVYSNLTLCVTIFTEAHAVFSARLTQ